MGNVVTVHLIRHEKTKANIERKYIGWTDESIVVSKKWIVPIEHNVVYGSDLKRCEETATLYFPKATFKPSQNLRELHFGEFEMKTYEQLKDNDIYRKWIDRPEIVTPPNGESYHEFVNRVVSGFQEVIQSGGEYTFVVHGGVIRVLLSLFGPKLQSFQQVRAEHRTIYTLTWRNVMDLKGGARCESLSVEPIMEKETL